MPKSIQIRIAGPCHERWSEMTPTRQGAFCHSCKKNVVDFTRKTENEIYDLVTQPGAQLCGRFTQFQLQQPIRKTEVVNGWLNWRAIAASLAGLLALSKQASAGDLEGKQKTATVQAANKMDTVAIAAKNGMLVAQESPPVITDTTAHRLKSRVIDADTKEPVGYATIIINGTKVGVVTNEDGYFDFGIDKELYKNDTLTIDFIGYERKEIAIADLKQDEPVLLKLREIIMGGIGFIVVTENNPLAEEQGGYNDLTPWFERHKTRRINKGK